MWCFAMRPPFSLIETLIGKIVDTGHVKIIVGYVKRTQDIHKNWMNRIGDKILGAFFIESKWSSVFRFTLV